MESEEVISEQETYEYPQRDPNWGYETYNSVA